MKYKIVLYDIHEKIIIEIPKRTKLGAWLLGIYHVLNGDAYYVEIEYNK